MLNSISTVRTGNTCHPPLTGRLLRKKLSNKKIDLAGVGVLVDDLADKSAINVVDKHGLLPENCKDVQFNASLARKYDLMLAMEEIRLEQVSSIAPEARGKTMLLGHWDNKREIPDPYKRSEEAFDSVFILIDKACQSWADKLSGQFSRKSNNGFGYIQKNECCRVGRYRLS